MKVLGVDFGERHIGLAISDDDARIAVPVDTVTRSSDAQAVRAILAAASEWEAEAIVVGEPRRLDGSRGSAASRVQGFAAKLGAATALPILLHDEALTSHEAAARLRAGGASRRRRRQAIHAAAAQVLLQDWLDRRHA